jgi:hypothetical protein
MEIEPRTLAYLRSAPEPEFAAEICVMDKDGYYTVICMTDEALINMAATATKLIAERRFFKGKLDNEQDGTSTTE